jgi:hypothetical protein
MLSEYLTSKEEEEEEEEEDKDKTIHKYRDWSAGKYGRAVLKKVLLYFCNCLFKIKKRLGFTKK